MHCTDLYLESERAFALLCVHTTRDSPTPTVDAVATAFAMDTCGQHLKVAVTVAIAIFLSRKILCGDKLTLCIADINPY